MCGGREEGWSQEAIEARAKQDHVALTQELGFCPDSEESVTQEGNMFQK